MFRVISILMFAVFGAAAIALAANAAVDPVDLIAQGQEVINTVATRSAGTGTAVGAIVYFLINLLKMKSDKEGNTLADKIIPKRYRPLVAAVLGAAGGFAATLATGGTLPVALSVMLASGSIPVLLNELVSTTLKGEEKEKIQKKLR